MKHSQCYTVGVVVHRGTAASLSTLELNVPDHFQNSINMQYFLEIVLPVAGLVPPSPPPPPPKIKNGIALRPFRTENGLILVRYGIFQTYIMYF